MNMPARSALSLAAAAAIGLHGAPALAQALIINDTLTGAATTAKWIALGGACLTAGGLATSKNSTVPSCSALAATGQAYENKTQVGGVTGRIYPTPDPVGQGALRLTNGDTTTGSNGDYTTGAIVSDFIFPTSQGVQVTWTSVTYGGDGNNGTGADGMTFFLADGGTDTAHANPASVGATGGSLGYSCSNGNPVADGVYGGYLGIGIDEYGNFSNSSDTTSTGPGASANRISLRGSGSTNWKWLNANYPTYYPGTLSAADQVTAVQDTCQTGTLWDFSKGAKKASQLKTQVLAYNYNFLQYSDVPSSTPIANQEATKNPLRGKAIPIVYSLKLSSNGLLDFSYSVNGGATTSVVSGRKITDSNGPLPKNFRFGFTGGTGGGSNVHEITCFKAAPADTSSTSGGSNVQESGRRQVGSQMFLAFVHPNNWWGQVTAQALYHDTNADALAIATAATWDGNCVLTGGTCDSMANAPTIAVQASSARSILSWNGSAGIPFQWSKLATTQQSTLTAGETSNDTRLKFLRGDRTNEAASGGTYRTRTGVLADITDSSPTWVGQPNASPAAPLSGNLVDKLRSSVSTPEGSTYAGFASANASRLNVVYAGANDGMLHGFRAGSFDASGNFDATYNDGREVLAYVPSQALAAIHSSTTPALDYSSQQYAHNFYVDATPGVGDLYYKGAWHTWLVGGLGPGGQAGGAISDPTASAGGSLYALDVTDPTQFSESNAASLVIGEISASSFSSCVNVPSNCNTNLGLAFGTPLIRRLHDGNWAVLFGNGLNSASGTAGLYILHVDSATGAQTLRFLDTKYTSAYDPQGAGKRNGIVQVSAADLDGDHVTDYVYAGDVFGNLWRFDLTDSSPSKWSVGSSPIFSAPAGQPITTQAQVAIVPSAGSGGNKVLVIFGTGQKTPQTLSAAESYATGTQSLYGIWDWDMTAWNAKSPSTKFDALTAPQTVTTSTLQAQTVTTTLPGSGAVTGYREMSSNVVCWSGSTACQSGNTMFGWKLNWPTSTEQVVFNPTVQMGMVLLNTIVPATQQILTCSSTPPSGYTMAVSAGTGGATASSVFPNAAGSYTSDNISGIAVGGVGTPAVVTDLSNSGTVQTYIVEQTRGGSYVGGVNPPTSGGRRVNWTKIR
jgi:type IV pilus assembly protein PilY1